MYVVVFELFLTLLFLVVIIHGIHKYNVKRLASAFTLIALIVTVEENLAMHFTGNYSYPPSYHLWIGEFPVAIMLAWIVVSYLGFLVARKLNSIILGGISASSIDVLLEPLACYFGLWMWHPTVHSPIYYFNAPVPNALGWIGLSMLGTIILKKSLKK